MPKKRSRKNEAHHDSKRERHFTIGIDLGGTKVAAALVDSDGNVLSEVRRPTVPPGMLDQDPNKSERTSPSEVKKHIQYVVDAMAEAAEEATRPVRDKSFKGRLLGLGLASAGPMNIDKGTLDYPSNFKGWKVVPLVEMLEKALAARGLITQVAFQNDAIAAALGEGWVGRAKEMNTYCMITVGTGIGSGVILNGRPCQSQGMGSEWGHMLANVEGLMSASDSFNDRSVEGLASGTGIVRRAKTRGFKGKDVAELAKMAARGDKMALQTFREASEGLAALMYTLSLGVHPEIFVVSGGMLAIRQFYLPQAVALYRDMMKRKNPRFLAPVKVSQLGTKAGAIGAARLPYLN